MSLWKKPTDLRRPNTNCVPYLFLLILLLTQACDDPVLSEKDLLGTNVIGLQIHDSLPIRVHTEIDEVLNGTRLSRSILGSTDDPIFGKSTASIYSQVDLPTNNLNLGSDLKFDSVVLSLRFNGRYGALDNPVDIFVYQMDQDITDGSFLTDQVFPIQLPELAAVYGYTFNTSDSVGAEGKKLPAQLRIVLDRSFGRKLMNQSGGKNFVDNTAFHDYLNGLFITVGSNQSANGFAYFNLIDVQSRLTVYYSNDEGGGKKVRFPIASTTDRLNHYAHNRSGSLSADFISTDSSRADSMIFLSSMGGTKGYIHLIGLDKLKNIAINKAELTLTQQNAISGLPEDYGQPLELIVFRQDEEGNSVILKDLSVEGGAHFGGGVETSEAGPNTVQYRFNITRYAQRVVNGELPNNGLYLTTVSSNVIADKIVLGGSGDSKRSIRFKLFYTETN